MAEYDVASTLPNSGSASPKQADKIDTVDAITRVNTREGEKMESTQPTEIIEKEAPPAVDESQILTGVQLALAHTGFLLATFCTSLDQTIVSTALPKLASHFNALDQLTWVVSAYLLTQAGLMLTFGQILTIASPKWVYLTCIIIFEIGSLICGVSPSMSVLIFGRAIQGVGASGILISIYTLLAQISRIEQRPLLFSTFGATFALASILGPLLGGVFTDHVSWRWCFYINLPFGAISVSAAFLFLPSNQPPENPLYEGMSKLQKWLALDWIGAIISIGMICSLLLPLQWGGVTRPWNDRTIIALFCVFGVLFPAFLGWEFYKGKRAMLPLFLFRRRTQNGAGIAMSFMWISFLAGTYYLPLFYQAKGKSASNSGIQILPFMFTMVIASFVSGAIVNATGHYLTMFIVGPMISAVGAGLLFTINEYTSTGRLIGYQIVYGVGLGMAGQMPVMAIQAEYALEPELIPQGSSLLTFVQLLGSSIGIAIAGTILNNQLIKELSHFAADLSPEMMQAVKQSVTVIFQLPKSIQGSVVHAYVRALDYTFILSIPACACATMGALLVRNWNLKKRGMPGGAP